MKRVVMLLENNGYPRDVRPRREAESLTRAGYRVKVIAPREAGEAAREVVGGVEVRRFRLPQIGSGALGLVVEYLIANLQLYAHGLLELARGAHVLHIHNPPDTFFAISWIARLLGRRTVFDLHDLAPELFVEKFGRGPVVSVLETLERLSMRASNRALTVNGSIKDLIVSRSGVEPDKVAVMRNVPPRKSIPPDTPARDGELREPHLVFLGSMESQDGVDDLPRLMARLRDEHGLAGARMTVIGDGGRRADVERGMRELGFADTVRFLGYVAHDDVPGLLTAADICLEPAARGPLNDLCSMVKVAEYMAAGRPVVCFPLPEIKRMAGEAVQYAETERLEEFAELIARLAREPELRLELARRGRERALELTWERSEDTLLGVYASL